MSVMTAHVAVVYLSLSVHELLSFKLQGGLRTVTASPVVKSTRCVLFERAEECRMTGM